jgi:hypothetical protein
MATKIKWNTADFLWNSSPHTWDEVLLVAEVFSDAATGEEIAWNVDQLEPEKRRRFIKLVCKVKGIETYSGQKTIRDDIKVSAEDCELVVKEVLGIELTAENIHV